MLNFKGILCLNGRLPDKAWFAKQQRTTIIAADGAANKLLNQDIIPDFIIGDLDSINKNYLVDKYNVIHIESQDITDFEKCLLIMQNRELFPALVLGIAGGELDHTIYNLNCFMRWAKKLSSLVTEPAPVALPLFANIRTNHDCRDLSLIFLDIDENNKFKAGIPVFGSQEFRGQLGKTISLLPSPEAVVSTMGLKWELATANLSVAANASVRNLVVSECAMIHVHSGSLLIVIDET